MTRPVRPVALVILTACMVYPGVTMLFQGGYPFVAGEWFNLRADYGLWAMMALRFGIPPLAIDGVKMLVGAAWAAGVLGLWAGDMKAYPLVLGAAAITLLYGGGPTIMSILALICLLGFREKAEEVPA